MIVALLLNHILDVIGIFAIITTTVKIALRYPVKRWFF
jgi:hypothetical protein